METTEVAADTAVVTGLESVIADSYSLMAQTHLAHWNVEGTDFFQLHVAFQGQYEELFTAIDDIAEHLRTLEAYAPGGLEMLSEISAVKPMKKRESSKDFVAGLVAANEAVVASCAKTRDLAADLGDKETEDLMIARVQVHNKNIWMLKSHLK